jgi:hypothetical protein
MKKTDVDAMDQIRRARVLRDQTLELLRGGSAHLDFDKAVAGLPAKLRGAKPAGQPHTPWRLVEHLRIAQGDILEFCRNPRHVSPKWPDAYWPDGDAPPDGKAWSQTLRSFRADHKAMQRLIANPAADLLAPIPGGQGQTLLREAMLVADHNAYHLGQLVILRRLLGAWED